LELDWIWISTHYNQLNPSNQWHHDVVLTQKQRFTAFTVLLLLLLTAIILGSIMLSAISVAGLLAVYFSKPLDTSPPLVERTPVEENVANVPEPEEINEEIGEAADDTAELTDYLAENSIDNTADEMLINKESEEEPFEIEETETSIADEADQEDDDQWLPTRERADALLEVCNIYVRFTQTDLPISLLIGPVESGDIKQLTGEQLSEAISFKEDMDTISSTFGFSDPQMLFDHFLYGSISQDRSRRIEELLNVIAPKFLESHSIKNRETRDVVYSSIFNELVAVGEFLPSDRDDVVDKWHQEFVDISSEDEPDKEQPNDNSDEKIDSALESIDRSRVDELPSPTLKKIAQRSQKKAINPRLKKIEKAQKLAKRHGVTLENLIRTEDTSEEESDKLLDLIVSARGDAGEEYSGYTKGTAADLLIESLLRVQLQTRTLDLYNKYQHLADYETIEQRIMDSLVQEFGPVVIKNHRSSIEQNLEWAANDGN